MPGPVPGYELVDPRTLYVPRSRAAGADPIKFTFQLSRHGRSTAGMPAIEVWEDPDGRLVISNGVTRAVRVAKLLPGVLVRIEVTQALKRPLTFLRLIADLLP